MDSSQLQVGSARASHFVDAETCEFHRCLWYFYELIF